MQMIRRVFLSSLLALLCWGVPVSSALASELDDAKSNGWVGERRDGYLGVVSGSAPQAAQNLVNRVNAEREKAYDKIAAQNGITREQVEKLAGQKLIDRALPGQFVMDAAGRWVKR